MDIVERYNVIMDGRDIGTVVLPYVEQKISTASAEERAKRRMLEFEAKDESGLRFCPC